MVALKGGAPVREDLLELAALQVWLGELRGGEASTDASTAVFKRRPDVA